MEKKEQSTMIKMESLSSPPTTLQDVDGILDIPQPMQIVMLLIGTRGDVQPFIAIGQRLKDHGHRVRLATHPTFKDFALSHGLEFYPIGGDPKLLCGLMVKYKGSLLLSPSDVRKSMKQFREVFRYLPLACLEPDINTGVPFKADVIISNPVSLGTKHVAEWLKIPIHYFFSTPWTVTSAFPHPYSNIRLPILNKITYYMYDAIIWIGFRSFINNIRTKHNLRPLTYLLYHKKYKTIKVKPITYTWSSHLLPKPKDWGPEIDVVGSCFLDTASDYAPPDSLVKWMEAGKRPIYIGFGSLQFKYADKITKIVVKALEITGQRGIVTKGWGGLGLLEEPKDCIYLMDECPHDWLFKQCKALVHHGGTGTTAAGLRAGCPTTVVAFFGEQILWGEIIYAKGLGPRHILIDDLSLEKLVDAINFMLDPKVKERACEISKLIQAEDGVEASVRSFYKHLPAEFFKCQISPSPDSTKPFLGSSRK